MEWAGKDDDVAIIMGLWDREEDSVIAMWQGIWPGKVFLWTMLSYVQVADAAEVDGGVSLLAGWRQGLVNAMP